MATLANVNEWAPIAVSVNPVSEASLFFCAFIVIWKRVRIEMASLLILLILVYLALQHEGHLQLLGIVGQLLVAWPLGEIFAVTGAEGNGAERGGLAGRCRRRPGYTDGRNAIDSAVQPSRQCDVTWFGAGSCAIGIAFTADI